MNLIPIAVGLLLLFLGRRLYWLFVGGAGFVGGLVCANNLAGHQSETVVLVVALALGIAGALFSLFVQKLAVALAGAAAGAYIFLQFDPPPFASPTHWLLVGLAAVVGLALVFVLFDWALILLSSFVGALLLIAPGTFTPTTSLALALIVGLVGVVVQARDRKRRA